MKKVTCTLLIALSASAYAAPADGQGQRDALGDMLTQRNLLDRIGEVTQQVETKASDLVLQAMAFLGVPYKWGGTSAESGFDCSGFVRAVYEKTAGKILPRRADQQAAATEKIERADLQPGDLVFFNTLRRTFSHVGIYIGNGKFIHAPRPGAEVRIEDMGIAYWSKRFDGARRVTLDKNANASNTP